MSHTHGTFQAKISSPPSSYLEYDSLTGFNFHPELHSRVSLIDNGKVT